MNVTSPLREYKNSENYPIKLKSLNEPFMPTIERIVYPSKAVTLSVALDTKFRIIQCGGQCSLSEQASETVCWKDISQ